MVLKKIILVLMFVITLGSSSENTGVSYCIIKIVPVGSGDNGTVLFKTYYSINPMGWSIITPVEIGWLVASANGIWKESRHVYLNFSDGLEITSKDSLYLNEFYSPFNWEKSPESVLPLLKAFNISTPLRIDCGKNVLAWTNNGVYKRKSIKEKSTIIRSLKGIKSQSAEGTPITTLFYHKGIALFRSMKTSGYESPSIIKGAVFLHGIKIDNEEVWIEEYSIDGVMFFKDGK
jgi:hypothetical protein